MSRFFNVNVDSIINDHELSYQNTQDNFIKECKQMYDKLLKLYKQKVEEHGKVLKLLAGENDKIIENYKILQKVAEKVEHEKQVLEEEKDHLESINIECRFLEEEESNLNNLVKETKEKESQVFQEKKSIIKKFKREINAFKTGVDMYEHFLQVNMNIEDNKSNSVINIMLKNSKNSINYNVIFEECDNNFKLIDIKPCSQQVVDAVELYNQNNDVQGLLAFLYKLQTRNQ